MEVYQERVVLEKAELNKKIDSLQSFIDTEVFAGFKVMEKELLVRQVKWMLGYSAVLAERVAAF